MTPSPRAVCLSPGTDAWDRPVPVSLTKHSPARDGVRILAASESRSSGSSKPARVSVWGLLILVPIETAELSAVPRAQGPSVQVVKERCWLGAFFFFFFLVFLPFLELLLRHMEVPKLGVELEL